jgi:hypothetical protein
LIKIRDGYRGDGAEGRTSPEVTLVVERRRTVHVVIVVDDGLKRSRSSWCMSLTPEVVD